MAEEGVYENPWLYEGEPFLTDSIGDQFGFVYRITNCLLYTSPSPRDGLLSRMPSSA